jgi:hypothetical protein
MPNMTLTTGSYNPFFKAIANPFVSLHEALTPCEDCWSLSTVNGEIYEDVVMMELTRDTVTIQHEYGIDTIARAELDRESQKWLIDNFLIDESSALESDDHFGPARPMKRAESLSHAA